jgi:hypothetical protein
MVDRGIQIAADALYLLEPAAAGEKTIRGYCEQCGGAVVSRIALPVERDAVRGAPAIYVWRCEGCGDLAPL